jgi:hypothetical protein
MTLVCNGTPCGHAGVCFMCNIHVLYCPPQDPFNIEYCISEPLNCIIIVLVL